VSAKATKLLFLIILIIL